VFSDASNLSCSTVPLTVSLTISVLLALPATAADIVQAAIAAACVAKRATLRSRAAFECLTTSLQSYFSQDKRNTRKGRVDKEQQLELVQHASLRPGSPPSSEVSRDSCSEHKHPLALELYANIANRQRWAAEPWNGSPIMLDGSHMIAASGLSSRRRVLSCSSAGASRNFGCSTDAIRTASRATPQQLQKGPEKLSSSPRSAAGVFGWEGLRGAGTGSAVCEGATKGSRPGDAEPRKLNRSHLPDSQVMLVELQEFGTHICDTFKCQDRTPCCVLAPGCNNTAVEPGGDRGTRPDPATHGGKAAINVRECVAQWDGSIVARHSPWTILGSPTSVGSAASEALCSGVLERMEPTQVAGGAPPELADGELPENVGGGGTPWDPVKTWMPSSSSEEEALEVAAAEDLRTGGHSLDESEPFCEQSNRQGNVECREGRGAARRRPSEAGTTSRSTSQELAAKHSGRSTTAPRQPTNTHGLQLTMNQPSVCCSPQLMSWQADQRRDAFPMSSPPIKCSEVGEQRDLQSGKVLHADQHVTLSRMEVHMGAVWRSARWKFVSAVCMALIIGVYANERRSLVQVSLALLLQVIHTAVVWAVAPLRKVGVLVCIVEVEQTVLLVVAALLLALGPRSPDWLRSWMAWMFSIVIGTMMVGDAVAAIYKAAAHAVRAVCLRLGRIAACPKASKRQC
jgi:hypothetical protein